MQEYEVTATNEINDSVRYCTLIVDGTKIHGFSKELVAYIEMCLAFSPYDRQDDPRTAGAMDTYFRNAIQNYTDVPYADFHDYLARRFHAWYTLFKPESTAIVTVVSAEDARVGDVVEIEGADRAHADPPDKKKRYSLEHSAGPGAAAAAAAGAAAVLPVRQMWQVRLRRRTQPLLLRLRTARPNAPRAMLDSQ
jgi:hypothetical protein